MFSALYYPHTQLSTSDLAGQRILKRALLMWDHLEFIVPDPHFKTWYDDPLVAEAIELIGKNHYPSDEEKANAHDQIEELITRPFLPEAFYYSGFDPYEVYPQKLLPDTWELLEKSGHAGPLLEDFDRPVSNPFGHAVMAILADCCAGTTRSRVTDRLQAYASLAGLLKDDPIREVRDRLIDINLRATPPEEALVSLRLSLPDIDNLSLEKLIQFRKREASQGGHAYRKLRHNFVEKIEGQVRELTSNPKLTKSDITELEERFFQENVDEFTILKEELGFEIKDVAKDFLVTVVAGSATLAANLFPEVGPVLRGVVTAAGAPVTINGAVSAGNKFFKARAEILRKHPLALLYELQKS
jgi:hypothetical protein